LCALVAIGSDSALVAGLALGSFVVQTHVSAAPVVALALAAAGAQRLGFSRQRSPGTHEFAPVPGVRPLLASLAALAVLWAPPVIEELSHRPGNLTLVWRFFTSPHPHHSLTEALRFAAAALRPWSFAHDFGSTRASAGLALPVVAAFAAACVALALAGRARGQRLPVALGATALVGLLGGTAGITRIVGPVSHYLIAWMTVLPVVLATGVLILVAAPLPTAGSGHPLLRTGAGASGLARFAGVAVTLVAATLAAGVLTWRMATLPAPQVGNSQTVSHLTGIVEAGVTPALQHHLRVDIASHDAWPDAAGLFLQLRRDGWGVTVGPEYWATIFGRQFRPHGDEAGVLEVWLQPDLQRSSPQGMGAVLGSAGGDTLVLRPSPGARR